MAVLLVSVALVAGTCEGSGGGSVTGVAGTGGDTRSYTVQYIVEANGDATVGQVRYRDPQGIDQTAVDPALPFSVTVTMEPGDEVALFASGEVTDGSLVARLVTDSSDGEGTILDEQDSCESPGTCNLGTPVFTLE